MKKLIKFLIVLLLLVGLGILVVWNLPKENLKGKSADLSIEAGVLYDEFGTQEEASNAKYIGKIIEVKGKIATVEKDEKGSTVLILQSRDPIAGIMCTLESGQESKIPENPSGKEIRIKGVCAGMLMDVVLNKCIILK